MKPTCSGLWQSMELLSAVVLGLAGISHAEASGYEKSELMIAMRDGVRLHTLVYKPSKQEGPLPIMLLRTPYGVDRAALARWTIISRTWPTMAISSCSRISAADTSPRVLL